MPFRCRIPVRFGDIDPAGVAYYPTLLHHCHAAFEEFFARALRTPYPEVLRRDRLGFPTVHLQADFRSPLRYGDVLDVEVCVAALGRSSVAFRYRGRVRGRLAFEAAVTTVCVDMRNFKTRPVPPRYRGLFSAHLAKRRA